MGCINCCLCPKAAELIDAKKWPNEYIEQKYAFGKTLGKGGSCRVLEAIEKSTNNKFAVKIMSRAEETNKELFEKERDILQILHHPNIIYLVEHHVDDTSYFLITDLCDGGELFDRIVDKNNAITEKRASQLVRTMLLSIKHCHEKNIVHRDIKPENFVFQTKDLNAEMVLIDFGCAKIVEEETVYKDLVGTPYYLAPESAAGGRYVRTGSILKSSDLWSIGVITYVLMTGRPPFNGTSNKEIFSHIIKRPLRFPPKVSLSKPFVDFCQKILKKSPKRRMRMEDAINHPWVQGVDAPDKKISEDVIRVLKQFNRQSKLKKAITKILAAHMGKEPKRKITEHFNRLDKDGDGALSARELSILLMDMGYTGAKAMEEAKKMIASTTDNDSGLIEFNEFAAIWQRKLLTVNKAYIEAVFSVLDTTKSGVIDANELAYVLDMNNKGDDEKIQEIIKEVDIDNDGKISFQEFRDAMLERDYFRGGGESIGHSLNAKDIRSAEHGHLGIDDTDM